jgi:hypothetical protein
MDHAPQGMLQRRKTLLGNAMLKSFEQNLKKLGWTGRKRSSLEQHVKAAPRAVIQQTPRKANKA